MKLINNRHGFNLVELIIGMAILTIIMAALLGVMPASFKSQQYNFEEGANIQDVRAVLNEITEEICNATAITTPTAASPDKAINITYRKVEDAANREITLGEANTADAGYVLFKDTSGTIVKKLGSGRIKDIDFAHDYVSETSSTSWKRNVTVQIKVKNSTKNDAPLSDLTTSVVTLNAF